MSDNQYLEDGFDPNTLKVSSLRNLLVKHEVEYPSNAKKSELVGILEKNVLSKASKLRKEAKKQRRAVADGRDIEVVVEGDMHTADTSSVSGRTRAKKTSKKAKDAAKKNEGADEQLPSSSRPAKRKHSETEKEEEKEEQPIPSTSSAAAGGGKVSKEKPSSSKTRPADTHKQRVANKRRIRHEQKTAATAAAAAAESSDESSDEEKKQRKPVTATTNETPKSKRARTTGNFSDDNP
ncbi:inner nuclear membrane protein enriched at telomere/subtelomere region, partial [Coemansia sp. RSA 2559]